MKPIYGEYECRLDAKGRFLLPSDLKRQLPEGEQNQFVMNRGIDKCLILYPVKIWEKELEKIYSRNQFVQKNRAFARMFMNGAARVELDGNSRVLVPKRLSEFAGLSPDIILVASFDRIEIWDKQAYDTWLSSESVNIERLSEEVMGGLSDDRGDGVS